MGLRSQCQALLWLKREGELSRAPFRAEKAGGGMYNLRVYRQETTSDVIPGNVDGPRPKTRPWLNLTEM